VGTFGGKQPNAGRKKGVPNKASIRRQAQIRSTGITPLDFMISILRNEDATPEDRKWAAQTAAPYVHPRLSSIEANAKLSIDPLEILKGWKD
jgi:hypothetical protein